MSDRPTVLFITHSVEEAVGLSTACWSPSAGEVVEELRIDIPRRASISRSAATPRSACPSALPSSFVLAKRAAWSVVADRDAQSGGARGSGQCSLVTAGCIPYYLLRRVADLTGRTRMVTRYQRAKLLEAAPALFAERHTPKTWSKAWPVIIKSGGTLVPCRGTHQFNVYTFRPGSDQPSADSREYELTLLAQQEQYASGAEIHALPGVFDYWSNLYVLPQIQAAFGAKTITEIYAKPLAELAQRHARAQFYSIGSGDCTEEIKIARYLLEHGCAGFEIIGLEVADGLIAEAQTAIALAGLSGIVSTRYFDVNRAEVAGPVHAYIAHHSLHHIVALERLFDLIARTLPDDGHFITCDMIGRNGHMRWPETLRYVEEFWAELPDVKKFHWQFKQQHENFVNWDCTEGGKEWEGIRAQDILPLLLARFSFAAFAAAGGFIDPFVERGYGLNFSADNPADRDFIDRLARRNDELLDAGVIKPTLMFADMMRKGAVETTRIVGNRSPEFCVRYPD